MKESKKLLIVCAVILIAIVIAVLVYFLAFKKEVTSFNLTSISESITTEGGYNNFMVFDADKEYLASMMEITEDEVEEVVGKVPGLNVKSTMFVIIKAKDGRINDVKSKVENYATRYEEQWSTYLQDQYELVKNRKFGVKGDYVYLIIAENADDLVKLIK